MGVKGMAGGFGSPRPFPLRSVRSVWPARRTRSSIFFITHHGSAPERPVGRREEDVRLDLGCRDTTPSWA